MLKRQDSLELVLLVQSIPAFRQLFALLMQVATRGRLASLL